jgi:hypothetical protein
LRENAAATEFARKCGRIWPDNHEENGLIGDGRRRAFTCRWEFLGADRRDARHQFDAPGNHSFFNSFHVEQLFFLPRPDILANAKTAGPVMVTGLAPSVARSFGSESTPASIR